VTSSDPSAPSLPLREQHAEAAVQAFTRLGAAPKLTFPLALASVTVAVLAMHADMVAKYSLAAFWVGVVATLGLAVLVGRVMPSIAGATQRLVAALLLPTAGGAIVGVMVQTVVLVSLQAQDGTVAVRDLGGLVDSTEPVSWVLAGIVLGALPALAVSLFLMLAARALRRLVGNDASEGFSVAFTGCTGLLAAFGLVVVEPWELPPLFVVTLLAGMSTLIVFLVDGARLRFLREVWAGVTGGDPGGASHARVAYEIVPADRFRHDPSLAPMVTKAGAVSVLVRLDRRVGSYRSSAGEPIALLADSEIATTLPLRRRRLAAVAVLSGIAAASALAVFAQPVLSSALGVL